MEDKKEYRIRGNGKIEHVVVVMLENRSFDHMLGFLKQLNPEVDGLTGNETCPYDPTNPSQGSAKVSNDATYITSIDPSHSLDNTTRQVFGYQNPQDPAPMNGFVRNYSDDGDSANRGADIMKCFSPSKLSVLSTLANEFAVFDHWHADLPGPTQPNRMFVHSGTSYGATGNDVEKLALGYPQKTIFDSLHESGCTWKDYFQDVPSILVLRSTREPHYWDNFALVSDFMRDCANGTLPNYSFVEPMWFDFFAYKASDQHPPHDIKMGENFLADVYEAVRNSPKWNNTLLIITYDEHGGFYDHVPTPQKDIPAPDEHTSEFDFTRLGVRIPCVMISPWIDRRTVIHEPSTSHYCNSSIPATLKKMFNLPSFLTKRDAWAATFETLVDMRDTPRTDCPTTLKRPGSKREQLLWAMYNRAGVTTDGIKQCMDSGGPISLTPLTDLQREIIAMAKGICRQNNSESVEDCLIEAEEETLDTEHDGAIFVRKQTLNFLKKIKDDYKKTTTSNEWVFV